MVHTNDISRRLLLRRTGSIAAAVAAAGALSACGNPAASASAPTTREFLLTMWGMKPYEVPQGETAKSIVMGSDGTLKWTNLPLGPAASTYATVHHFVPGSFTVMKGDHVKLTVINLGLHHHGFAIPDLGIDFLKGGSSITGERGDAGSGKLRGTATGGPDARTVTFVADKAGIFTFMCNLPFNKADADCNPLHDKIIGQLIVLG